MSSLMAVESIVVTLPLARNAFGRVTRSVQAVRGVSLAVPRGATLGLVGESGSGKSTIAAAIVGLVPLASGQVLFNGQILGEETRRSLRGRIQIVFQDPRSSLNPRLCVWRLIVEPLEILGEHSKTDLRTRADKLMQEVGLSAEFAERHPHELSGGQRQRVAIARSLASDPDLLVLDEPTSALDVSVQAQVISLLLRLQADRGISYLFISHDIGVIRHVSDEVAVMQGGKVVESGAASQVLDDPQVPYTQALLKAVPMIGAARFKTLGDNHGA